MKIIVTGGAGFIGSNFIYYMMEKHSEDQIICLDALTYAGHMSTLEVAMKNPAFRFVKASVTDRVTVYRLFEEEHPDIVVNFAAESHVDRSIENPEVFLDTNIKGTAVLMDACRKYGIWRYHQVSTDEVYGDLPLERPDLFLQKRHQSIRAVRTVHPRQRQIFWYSPITERMDFRLQSVVVPTTMDHIICRKS